MDLRGQIFASKNLLINIVRWGKTLNMSMLHHFFAPEVNGVSTAGLFDELAIGKLDGGRYIAQHQGKYPVIKMLFTAKR
ncbi:AAA family ATPase [Cardinium endosymbiont of Nabis limbatus]|uniref:AAA family ATPase n=1 Tax=Cardinium endosymbiont of Nabis limbatus TaxID=3066217 RepID=UPI003AF3338D